MPASLRPCPPPPPRSGSGASRCSSAWAGRHGPPSRSSAARCRTGEWIAPPPVANGRVAPCYHASLGRVPLSPLWSHVTPSSPPRLDTSARGTGRGLPTLLRNTSLPSHWLLPPSQQQTLTRLSLHHCCLRRKTLAIYPVVLLYASIGWLALVKS